MKTNDYPIHMKYITIVSGEGQGEGQGSLVCCSPWGQEELDMTK